MAEVAEWLKLNQQTIRNWIDAGSLPAVRVGRRVRIKRSDLDKIVAAGYKGSLADTSPAPAGPSAEDFWSGEAVGDADPDPDAASAAAEALARRRAEAAAAEAAAAEAAAAEAAAAEAAAAEVDPQSPSNERGGADE